MMIAIILVVLAWETYSLARSTTGPGWGVASTLASVAVVVVISRGTDWNGGMPFALWPLLVAWAAVLVGLRVARLAAARTQPAPRPGAA